MNPKELVGVLTTLGISIAVTDALESTLKELGFDEEKAGRIRSMFVQKFQKSLEKSKEDFQKAIKELNNNNEKDTN